MKNLILIALIVFCNKAVSQTFEWAKRIGGALHDSGARISVDSTGNIYLMGSFQGTVDFNPGSGVFNLTSSGSDDFYVAKFDSLGNFLWAKKIGGTSQDFASIINVDPHGNITLIGWFQSSSVDFDPGPGNFRITGYIYHET